MATTQLDRLADRGSEFRMRWTSSWALQPWTRA